MLERRVTENGQPIGQVTSIRYRSRGHAAMTVVVDAAGSSLNSAIVSAREMGDQLAIDLPMRLVRAIGSNPLLDSETLWKKGQVGCSVLDWWHAPNYC